jgi:hypothetical protein
LADEGVIGLINMFIEHSGCSFVSEFAQRGGLKLLAHLEAMQSTEMAIIKHRYAFCVFCYMAQVTSHPFDPENPNWFRNPDAIINEIMTNDSLPAAKVLAKALLYYIAAEYPLGSLDYMGKAITNRLHELYPRYYGTEAYLGSGWEYIDEGEIDEEIYNQLEAWDKKHYVPKKLPLFRMPMKYTAAWYDRKAESAKTYGLPGDVEILQAKATALRRWKLVEAPERQRLIGLLNKPTRYDDPGLNMAEWDERAWHVDYDPEKHKPKFTFGSPELAARLATQFEEILKDFE